MTLWRGQFGAELLHDYHPPIPDSGLFWTLPVPPESLTIDLEAGTATLLLEDLVLPDAVGDAQEPATLSLLMQWSGASEARDEADPQNGFAGTYRECSATIAWTVAQVGFSFASDASATSVTRSAQLGRERTGIFAAAD